MKKRSDVFGWAAIAFFVTIFDVVSLKNSRPTLSGTVWQAKSHAIGGPLAVAIWAAVTYHLFFYEKKLIILDTSA